MKSQQPSRTERAEGIVTEPPSEYMQIAEVAEGGLFGDKAMLHDSPDHELQKGTQLSTLNQPRSGHFIANLGGRPDKYEVAVLNEVDSKDTTVV